MKKKTKRIIFGIFSLVLLSILAMEGGYMVYVGHCAKTLLMLMICTRRPG